MSIPAYHGTSVAVAGPIVDSKIDVTQGGGELGQGFYMAERRYISEIWAKQRHQHSPAVVELELSEDLVFADSNVSLDLATAAQLRTKIRDSGQTRSYHLGCDMAMAPIVGTTRGSIHGQTQIKAESAAAQTALNSAVTPKRLV